MNRHPGGIEHTKELLAQAGMPQNTRILDMGAGDGAAVEYMREMGYEAEGIDLCSDNPLIICGDFLKMKIPEQSYGGVLSQCAFLAGGQVQEALQKSRDILMDGGKLMYSDVSFLSLEDFLLQVRRNGFSIDWYCDLTRLWKEYYIESIWMGTDQFLPECFKHCKQKTGYYAVVAERISHGFV